MKMTFPLVTRRRYSYSEGGSGNDKDCKFCEGRDLICKSSVSRYWICDKWINKPNINSYFCLTGVGRKTGRETLPERRGLACAARGRNLWDIHAAWAMADSGRTPQARALLQQCLHARLQVRPAEGDVEAEWVEVTLAPQLRLSYGAQGRFSPCCPGDSYPALTPSQPAGAWQVVRSALDSWPVHPTLPLMPAWPRLSPQSCITGPGPFSLGLPEEIKRDPGDLSFLSNDLPELGVLQA